jgi:NADPH:quinone reductase-like Zn-dependent oxidoreductase
MKAIVYETYGPPDVLRLRDVETPVAKDDEVLVRVRATSANPHDWHFIRGLPYFVRLINGLRRPKKASVPGVDLAGQVEAVGGSVEGFRPGDDVFAGVHGGGFAEYACVAGDLLEPKPANLTFEQAAAVPAAAFSALQALRDKGDVRPGQKVAVNGASGGVGTFAVQIAKAMGAEVTGVCSTRNLEMVRSLGADHVIDYTRQDFTKGGRRYDVILDNGYRSLSDCRRALTSKGTLVLIGGTSGRWIDGLGRELKARALSPFVSQRLRPFLAKPNRKDLAAIRALIEAGKVTPVIDRTYPLSEAPEAIRYLEVRRPPMRGGHEDRREDDDEEHPPDQPHELPPRGHQAHREGPDHDRAEQRPEGSRLRSVQHHDPRLRGDLPEGLPSPRHHRGLVEDRREEGEQLGPRWVRRLAGRRLLRGEQGHEDDEGPPERPIDGPSQDTLPERRVVVRDRHGDHPSTSVRRPMVRRPQAPRQGRVTGFGRDRPE